VIGGVDSPEARDAVVFVHVEHADGAFSDCTGTLITPHVSVTAKHCIARVANRTFVCSGSGELVEDGAGAGLFGETADPFAIEIYSGARPIGTPSARGARVITTSSVQACRDDLALIVLDRAIELDQYAALRTELHTRVGEPLRLVGYGSGQREGTVERRELLNVRVLDVGSTEGDDARATTPRRSLVVEGNTVCIGDSGGPALSMESGALVAVFSRISGDCLARESRNTFMLVAGYLELFERALEATGESAMLESRLDGEHPGDTSDTQASTRRDAFSCCFGGYSAPSSAPLLLVLLLAALRSRCSPPGACAGARDHSDRGA
jgi:hypothetical protein